MKQTKEQLIQELELIVELIKANDSFQGNISYDCFHEDCGREEFMVTGAFRYGNSDGQGFMRILS